MPDWRKQGQERVKDRKEGATLKLDDGTTCFRCMPDKADLLPDGRLSPKGLQNPPFREFRMHRKVGPDEGTVRCGKDIDGKGRCWLCDKVIPDLEKNPAKAGKLREIGPQEQFVIQASKFDVNTQKFKLPKLMWLSTGAGIPGKPGTNTLAIRVYSKLVSQQKDYIDPVKGFNLNVEKTGSGLKTRYQSVEGDESPTKVPLAVTAAVVSIDSLLPKYDEEDMKSLWFGRPRRDRDDAPRGRGEASDGEDDYATDPDAADAPMADDIDGAEFVDDPDADPGVDPDDPDYAADPDDPDALDPDADLDADPADDPDYVDPDYDPDAIDPDVPEEYSNDAEDPDPDPPPPPARRAAPPARQAPPARRPAPAPARRPAPPAARPAARPPAPPARPAARPAAAKRPAPAPAKKPGRR